MDGISRTIFEEEAYQGGKGIEQEADNEEVDDQEDDGATAHLGDWANSSGEASRHARGSSLIRTASRRKLEHKVVAVAMRTIQLADRPSCQGSSKVIVAATSPSLQIVPRRVVWAISSRTSKG